MDAADAARAPPAMIDPGRLAAFAALLAGVGIAIDVAIGLAYILAGSRLAGAMARPELRRGIERGVGVMYLALAAAAVAGLVP